MIKKSHSAFLVLNGLGQVDGFSEFVLFQMFFNGI
jgi:hypothetical protein